MVRGIEFSTIRENLSILQFANLHRHYHLA